MKTLITSDTHWGHKNIIVYSNRPFYDLNTMNREMTRMWNETVQPFDTVIHCGDFAMGAKSDIPTYLSKLNGAKKILIKGNHDPSATRMLEYGFNEVYDELVLEINGFKVLFVHKPPKRDRLDIAQYDYVIHGHVHGAWGKNVGKYIDAGVDAQGFYPKTFEELTVDIKPRTPVDWNRIDQYYVDRAAGQLASGRQRNK